MAQIALRFAVRASDLRGTTWKLWTESGRGSEVYLVSRALGGTIKTSLHESGRWHVAFSKKAFEDKVEGNIPSLEDRFIERWPRPTEISPGLTLAYRIVTPAGAITTPVQEDDPNDLIWIPNAPQGQATEIDIFLARPGSVKVDWPGQRSMNTELVGTFPLDSGETVYAVRWTIPMPVLPIPKTGTGRLFPGVSAKDIDKANLRAITFGAEVDGSRTIYDFAVVRKAES